MNEPPQIPDHTLLRLIGRGSYGEVWLARNVMGAGRAVKIVRRASFDSDRPFEREFAAVRRYEPASRMADGLVNVLHVGKEDSGGMFYYVMELADCAEDESGGNRTIDEARYRPRTLRTVMERQRRLCPADCIAIAGSLVQALASLHRAGLTHRDIKPSNIIFVNGRAKLADIGLVGDLGESRSFVGTEGYIPPEGPGLPGADLYALGMVLYEMVTGFPPAEYPRVPPEWMEQRNAMEMEFVEVVLHATESQALRRYQSAGELQADLALLESGKSVRRVHQLERRWKTARRVAALAALAAVLLGGGMWLWHDTQLREERAVAAERLADQARADEREQRFLALRERAARLVRHELGGWRKPALSDIDEAAKLNPNDVELRNTLITALSRADLTELARWSQPGGTTAGPVLSPDGALVAVGQEDGSFRILRTADGREVSHVRHWLAKIQPSFESAFTAGGSYFGVRFSGWRTLRPLVAIDFPYESWTWFRVADGKIVKQLLANFTCDGTPPRDDCHILAADTSTGELVTFNLENGSEVSRVKLASSIARFHTSPDGRLAAVQPAAGSYAAEMSAVETGSGKEIARWPDAHYMSGAVAWSPDSSRVLLGGSWSPRGVRILRVTEPAEPVETLMAHSAEIVSLAVSPDGRFVLTSSWDQTSQLIDLIMRRTVSVFPGYGHMGSTGFSADGMRVVRRVAEGVRRSELVVSSFDAPVADLLPVPGQVFATAFSSDGRWLAASHDRGLLMCDLKDGGRQSILSMGGCGVCAFPADKSPGYCAVAGAEGLHAVFYDEGSRRWTHGPALKIAGNNANAISPAGPGGGVIVWGGSGMSYRFDGQKLDEILPGKHIVSGGITADGSRAVYSRGGGSSVVLTDEQWNETAKLPAGTEPWAGISRDGRRISATSLRKLHCWDADSLQLLWEREKEFPFIRGSPLHTADGRWLIARLGIHPAILEVQTGRTMAHLYPAFSVTTSSASLDAAGLRLALSGRGYVLMWNLEKLYAELRLRGMWPE